MGSVFERIEPPAATGQLRLADRGQFLVRRGDAHGVLVAEVSVTDEPRVLWLPAERYVVQHRLPTVMREYQVKVQPSEVVDLDPDSARTIEYAQWVRKGKVASWLMGITVWGGVQSPVLSGFEVGFGGDIGYEIDLPWLSFEFRLGMATFSAGNFTDVDVWSLAFGVRKVLDWAWFSASIGARGGFSLLHQQDFLFAPHADAVLRMDAQLPAGFLVALEGGPRVSYSKVNAGPLGVVESAAVRGFGHLGLGYRW